MQGIQGPILNPGPRTHRVELQGAELAKVDEFKYLGSMVQENGKCERGEETDSGWLEQMEEGVRHYLRQEAVN